MKLRFLLLLFLCCSLNGLGQSRFSRAEVLNDLQFLRETLEETHYDLYAYTSREAFDSIYRQLRTSVEEDSLGLLETTGLLQRLVAAAKNGHTSIDFPVPSYIAYAQSGGTLFPLEIAIEGEKALIRKNWSDNDAIEIGSELLSINGVPISKILSGIYPLISAERPYFRNAKVELFSFPRYYWQVYGRQDDFKVKLRINGAVMEYQLHSIPVIEGYEANRTEILNARMSLEIMGPAAYLNPGGFGGDEATYRSFVDSSFAEIKKAKSKNLIIDLRNNPGGDDSFSDYLVSYIADRPFKWNSNFTLKTSRFLKEHVRKNYDTTTVFWQRALTHKDGEIYEYPFEEYQPQDPQKRYDGNVYVLINRQSHSQSAVTAAQIQDYQFGTLVGEETGDYPSLYASIFQFPLPNTGIAVNVSKGYMVRVNGSKKEEGVIPDIFIKDHLLDEEDEILNGLLVRLKEGR